MMARIRYLKPDFFKDEKLSEYSLWHRFLFQGLWVLADREGRLEDRSKWIKIEIFPYENKVDVDGMLNELHKAGFILRYEVSGKKYIQITNFRKHQKPHHTEKKSEIPEPPKLNRSLTVNSPLGSRDLKCTHMYAFQKRKEEEKEENTPLFPPSLSHTLSLPPIIPPKEEKEEEKRNSCSTELSEVTEKEFPQSEDSDEQTVEAPPGVTGRAKTPNPRLGGIAWEKSFARFWQAYPKRVSKGQAEKTWRKLSPDEQLILKILQGIERAKTSDQWLKDGGQFIPYPSTWLNAKGWEDEAFKAESGLDAWCRRKLIEEEGALA